jgi:hypothetical protein
MSPREPSSEARPHGEPERAARLSGDPAPLVALGELGPRVEALALRHLFFGWLGLLVFVLLGVVLEALHGLKAPWLLDPGSEARRLCLRLGHAHGTLLALVHVAYALSLRAAPRLGSALSSRALVVASVLIPCGFLLGAVSARGSDPGPLVLLVPAGALALVTSLTLTVAALARRPRSS